MDVEVVDTAKAIELGSGPGGILTVRRIRRGRTKRDGTRRGEPRPGDARRDGTGRDGRDGRRRQPHGH